MLERDVVQVAAGHRSNFTDNTELSATIISGQPITYCRVHDRLDIAGSVER
jgi:hypothetical protein